MSLSISQYKSELLACAGKTTLVERILTAQHGYRVAVILNEIGDEKGIEKALLQDEEGMQSCCCTCSTPSQAATTTIGDLHMHHLAPGYRVNQAIETSATLAHIQGATRRWMSGLS
jgi:hypothetical protein